MNSNNVIAFPNSNRNVFSDDSPQELDKEEALRLIREEYFDSISLELAVYVFDKISMCGIDIREECYLTDCVIIVESIKSLLMKTKNLEHPLQKLQIVDINSN